MRVFSHASEQYRRNSALAEKPREKVQTEPQAKVTTRSFGFRLGKFGMDFESSNTVLDPSLSRDVRERRQKARAFKVEAEVETLRAKVGCDGADYRDREAPPSQAAPTRTLIQTALTAYARSSGDTLPAPGIMLASVV